MSSRKSRALTQRMYCLDAIKYAPKTWSFTIQGSSVNTYKVCISDKIQTCECQDFKSRGIMCKHILMVIGRIANDKETFGRISIDNYTNIYTLNPDFDTLLDSRISNSSNDSVSNDSSNDSSNETHKEDDCCICYESMKSCIHLYSCQKCKNFFHDECIIRWKRIKNTCPLCRTLFEYSSIQENVFAHFRS